MLYLKPGDEKNFCIVDAAMNDLPRPAMYEAYHEIVPLRPGATRSNAPLWDVVGPVCESGDLRCQRQGQRRQPFARAHGHAMQHPPARAKIQMLLLRRADAAHIFSHVSATY